PVARGAAKKRNGGFKPMSNRDIAFSTMRKKLALAGASFLSGALLIGGVLIAPTAAGADGNTIPAAQKKLNSLKVRPTKIPVTTPIQGKIPTGKTIDWIVCGVPQCAVL